MNHGVRFEFFHRRGKEFVVSHVTDENVDGSPRQLRPGAHSLGQRADRRQRLNAQFGVPLPADKIVEDRNGVALLRQIQSRSPTAITRSSSLKLQRKSTFERPPAQSSFAKSG